MQIEGIIISAFVLDLVLGDPRWLPHPVRAMGALATHLEIIARKKIPSERTAGLCTALAVIGISMLAVYGAIALAHWIHPILADALSIYFIYTTIATRDLLDHSMAVYKKLRQNNLPKARQAVARIVGRDTEALDEAGVSRAAVEAVAESMIDGITAPLFFALLAGPVGAIAYRAINTLDSLFGYKNQRYRQFGWASARIDDVANWIPARLTAPLIALAAFPLGQHASHAAHILRRDRNRHPSPNAGFAEAAVAGALGVQLGGMNVYFGERHERPVIGDPLAPLKPAHILKTNDLVLLTTLLFLILGLSVRLLLGNFTSPAAGVLI